MRADYQSAILLGLTIIPIAYYLVALFHTNAAQAFMAVAVIGSLSFYVARKINRLKMPTKNRCVIVTGCDSGFGFAAAMRFEQIGYHVIATYLNDNARIKTLESDTLCAFHLDLTKEDSIEAFHGKILEYFEKNQYLKLWALVNNAGFYVHALFETLPFEYFQRSVDVNFFGPYQLSKLLLPMLTSSKGRIVNMCSLIAYIPLMSTTSYGASKCASSIFTRSLALELEEKDIRVIEISPFGFRTPLTSSDAMLSAFEKFLLESPREVREAYGNQHLLNMYREKMAPMSVQTIDNDMSPVIDDMVAAVTHYNPRPLYSPSPIVASIFVWLLAILPNRLQRTITLLFVYDAK